MRVHKIFIPQTCVVYNFLCDGCGAIYNGETDRHYEIRTKEHLDKGVIRMRIGILGIMLLVLTRVLLSVAVF